jgi:TfoX/Sxy family transcriptional regulator of competence genes
MRCVFGSCGDRIVAGAIANRSTTVIGLSNVFDVAGDLESAWVGAAAIAADLWDEMPTVGRTRLQSSSLYRLSRCSPYQIRQQKSLASRAPCAMIVTMAYDEDLASRIRELIASEDGYTEQKMFGGIGFMIDGHMAVGVSGEGGLMIHCCKEETEALLAKPGARPFEMRGREMKGWLRVDAESVSTKRALEPWAMQSVAFARALPPKKKKK